jgi:hypothetical protein
MRRNERCGSIARCTIDGEPAFQYATLETLIEQCDVELIA